MGEASSVAVAGPAAPPPARRHAVYGVAAREGRAVEERPLDAGLGIAQRQAGLGDAEPEQQVVEADPGTPGLTEG